MNDNNSQLLRFALIFIASTAIIIVGVQPIFIGLVAERLELSISQQGWVISIEMTGSVIGTLISPLLTKRGYGRNVYLSAALLTLTLHLVSAWTDSLTLQLICRSITGFGGGLLYAHSMSHLGRLPGQDRSFGLMLFFQTGVFAGFATLLPLLAESLGSRLAICCIGIWFLLITVASLAIPVRVKPREEHANDSAAAPQGIAAIGRFALVGMLFLQLAIYSIWGFIDQIGADQGINAVDVGWAFGIGVLGGLPGASLPSALGARVNRGVMIGIGSLLVLCAIGLLSRYSHTASALCLALFIINFGWSLALSYYMASITTNDPNGNLTPLVSIIQASAAAVAPAFIAVLVEHTDKQSIFLTSASAVTIGLVLRQIATTASRGRNKAFNA